MLGNDHEDWFRYYKIPNIHRRFPRLRFSCLNSSFKLLKRRLNGSSRLQHEFSGTDHRSIPANAVDVNAGLQAVAFQ